jgi:hemerythrin-like domain-containing protein
MITSAFQQLYAEHETIERMLDRMRTLIAADDRSAREDELREIVSFFREYADGYHHAKEDDILFPRMRELSPALGSIIEELADHHVMFREMLRRADVALGVGDWREIERTLGGYADALRDHISIENDELFVAGEMIDEGEKDRIAFEFVDSDEARGAARKRALEEHALQL